MPHRADILTPAAKQVFEHPTGKDQVRKFQAWERANAASMYLRYKDLPADAVFGLRTTDVIKLDLTAVSNLHDDSEIKFGGRKIGRNGDVDEAVLRSFLKSFDGERCVEAILADEHFAPHRSTLERLIVRHLGEIFFMPAVIAELEARIAAVELLRFPTQSRYAMPRPYWENSAVVRNALDVLYRRLDDVRAFSDGLRGLHRLATLGADGETYYGGAGGIATIPGEYRRTPIENHFNARKRWIIAAWLQLLNCSSEPLASGTIVSTHGIPLLQIADDGSKCCHLYGRRGEYLALQVNEIRTQLVAARAALEADDRGRLLYHCSLFHHAFVHAHPFNNINNSIAMNIVNDLLGKAEVGVLPHLYFDQVAYLMQPEDYAEFFRLARDSHVIDDRIACERPLTTSLREVITTH